MSTDKLRIQGYLQSDIYYQFDQERMSWGLSQSQALEKILSERYAIDSDRVDSQHGYSLQKISKELAKLVGRVASLEDFNGGLINGSLELPSELESVTSELPSELESVTSELPSELESVTSELPSELESVTNELPSELESVTSELPSELESVTSELPSELESVTSELPSELESVTSELPSELPGELSSGLSQRALSKRLNCSHAYIGKKEQEGSFTTLSASLDPQGISWELRGKKYYPAARDAIAPASPADKSDLPLVIYAFDTEANQYYYWEGLGVSKRGFNTGNLHHACKYKSEATAKRSLEAIFTSTAVKDQKYIFDAIGAKRFKIGFDSESFLRENRHTGVTRDR